VNEQNPNPTESPEQTPTDPPQVGCGFWALWVLALAAAGALTYSLCYFLPMSEYTLPPATLLVFGFLAGAGQGFVLRNQLPPVRRWIQASSLAGLVAMFICILPTGLAASSAGLYAGWAYAWAAYGAVLGVLVQRFLPGRRWMLASLLGWAVAGIVSGVVGLLLDVDRISGSNELLFLYSASQSQNWAIEDLLVVGAVCGAIGGAITGAVLVLQSRRPRDREVVDAADNKLANIAGVASGLAAALLGTFVAPLKVSLLSQGALGSPDLVVFLINMAASGVLCIPSYLVVCIPLGIGGGRIGLEIARTRGSTNVRPWVWFGAAVGGVVGYLLSSLVAFAAGHNAV
jgi:hypothetical protein